MRLSPVLKPITLPHSIGAASRDRAPVTPTLAAAVLLGLLGAYKALLSPLFAGCCRYEPSCSEYMRQAIVAHGAGRGAWLGLKRLCRCHPFGGYGADPCPPRP